MALRDLSAKQACRHCQKVRRLYGRGLCKTCYNDDTIKDQYPPRAGLYTCSEEPDCRPERLEGAPPYRCLWCAKWRCHERMRLCQNCSDWLARASLRC